MLYPIPNPTVLSPLPSPAPDIFLAAAAQRGVPPANCVVIEDAVAGVEAARAAGECGGTTWGELKSYMF